LTYAGLEVFINSFIKDIGLKPFVLPEGLTVPLTPGRVDGLVVTTITTSGGSKKVTAVGGLETVLFLIYHLLIPSCFLLSC